MNKKVLGFWSGHDASYCVLNHGIIEMHSEAERHTRIKEAPHDSIQMFYEQHGDTSDVIGLATCYLDKGIKAHKSSWEKIQPVAPLYVVGHHQAHAAHALYSSNFHNALIITIDGGGLENDQSYTVGGSVWSGNGPELQQLQYNPLHNFNIGGVWSRCTRCIFRYESGAPYGNQAGTVMALAALGDPQKYLKDFRSFFSENLLMATMRAPGHITGMSVKDPREPRHPFLGKWRDIADNDAQAKYDMAASLQLATEEIIRAMVQKSLDDFGGENLCISGGVALNSVAMGKLWDWFPQLKGIYIPPVPYDGGLTLGAAQYVWHGMLGNPRIQWFDNVKPYLGVTYDVGAVNLAVVPHLDKLTICKSNDNEVLELLAQGKIVSVFNGRAESGRRALGNRSILADPRDPGMKDRVNEKVKHRQSFRPFAPSIMRERVIDWFTSDHDSPFMGFVLKWREEKKSLVPAVVHFDGTARLQTVTARDNPWYHQFLAKWEQKSGVPILLNTSFNDSTPIVDSPKHAVKCFLGTDIDVLYFPEHKLLVEKK